MNLSSHFTLEELTVTQVRGVDNTPPLALLKVLRDTALRMEQIRDLLANPTIMTSGYRSPQVNERVGGSITSAHTIGHAVDFICPRFGTPLSICRAIVNKQRDIEFDQLIWEEENWVHISFAKTMRREVLTKPRKSGYIAGLGVVGSEDATV